MTKQWNICSLLGFILGCFLTTESTHIASLQLIPSATVVKSGELVEFGCLMVAFEEPGPSLYLRFEEDTRPSPMTGNRTDQTDDMFEFSTAWPRLATESGWYTCQARQYGSDYIFAETDPMEFSVYNINKSVDMELTVGENATLFCDVSGVDVSDDNIWVQWRKDGMNLTMIDEYMDCMYNNSMAMMSMNMTMDNDTLDMNSTANNSTMGNTTEMTDCGDPTRLMLYDVTSDDTGTYTCIVDFMFKDENYQVTGDIEVQVGELVVTTDSGTSAVYSSVIIILLTQLILHSDIIIPR
ncbi:uncharacterized protein LOC144448584 [Glandiceps talaboti]